MELPITQQIFDQFNKSNHVLIALPKVLHADSVGSALALSAFLKKQNKEVEIAAASPVPKELQFMPGVDRIKSSLPDGKSLVITVDTSVKELDELSYQTTDHKVSIFLKPKTGQFVPEDVSFGQDKSPFDTVVVLDASSLEDLGELYEHNTDIFFDAVKINIDNHPGNEYFAPINLVDINATSIAEILSSLFTAYETQLIDEDIATCLLAGLIAKTNSFQHVQTTPKAFLKASELISLGARQQEVVKFLYKTKSLPFLRLWGRALARLKIEEDLSTVYSILNLGDFGKAGAADSDLHAVLKELLDNISNYRMVALMNEAMGGGAKMLAAIHPQVDAERFIAAFGNDASVEPSAMGTYKIVRAEMENMPLIDAEAKFLDAVRASQSPAVEPAA